MTHKKSESTLRTFLLPQNTCFALWLDTLGYLLHKYLPTVDGILIHFQFLILKFLISHRNLRVKFGQCFSLSFFFVALESEVYIHFYIILYIIHYVYIYTHICYVYIYTYIYIYAYIYIFFFL